MPVAALAPTQLMGGAIPVAKGVGRRQGPTQERLAVQGRLCPYDIPWAVLPLQGRYPAKQAVGKGRLLRPPRPDT